MKDRIGYYVYDKARQCEANWFVDHEGGFYVDLDPYGVSMNAHRKIRPVKRDDEYFEIRPVSSSNWYCTICKRTLEPSEVTYEETHDTRLGGCGFSVAFVPPKTVK